MITDDCEEPICGGNGTEQVGANQIAGPYAQARSFEPRADALLQPAEDGALMASYSVFVVEPGAPVGKHISVHTWARPKTLFLSLLTL